MRLTLKVLFVSLLALAGCAQEPTHGSVDASSTPSPSFSTSQVQEYEAFLASGKITSPDTCLRYAEVFASSEALIDERSQALNKGKLDSKAASKFVQTNEWVRQNVLELVRDSVVRAARRSLTEVSERRFKSVPLNPYLEASLTQCQLDLSALLSTAQQLDSQTAVLIERADAHDSLLREQKANAPWYPKGFSEIEDGLAIKWTNDRCSINRGYCWTMEVISDFGCPNGLYVEVNVLQGRTVEGYTNDLLGSLKAGQKAKMEFIYFGGSGRKNAELTKVNCY